MRCPLPCRGTAGTPDPRALSAFTSRAPQGVPPSLELYLRDLGGMEPLGRQREEELARATRAGDHEAARTMICASLRYAYAVAWSYRGRGLDLEDLIQEANLGMVIAASRFDPERGVRFIHYADFWIRRAIRGALTEQGRTVRLPRGRRDDVMKLLRARAGLRQRLDREPTRWELADALEVGLEEVILLESWSAVEVSLDPPARSGGREARRAEARQLPAEDAASDAAARVEASETRRQIDRALRAVSPRHAHVLRLYYGLDDGREHSLEEISHLLGVTRQYVNVMRHNALKKAKQALVGEEKRERKRRSAAEQERRSVQEELCAMGAGELERICAEVLSPRERDVLYLYFGLGEDTEDGAASLGKVALHCGVSDERARQIRDSALKRVREAACACVERPRRRERDAKVSLNTLLPVIRQEVGVGA